MLSWNSWPLKHRQMVTGYPEESFRPKAYLTRAESSTLFIE